MAYEQPGFKFSPIAGESLVAAQYKFVKISANDTVVAGTDLTDIPCGILQNSPVAGLAAEVMANGISKLLVGDGGAVAAGNLIGCDAEGCAVVVDPDGVADNYYVGQVLEGGAAGELCTVLFNCMTPVIQSGS